MKRKPRLTCPACGTEYSGAMEFCPVCILRSGLATDIKAGEPASEDTVKPTIERRAQRFGHYELTTGADGKPVELGRGAMGITYKAVDVDLHCPVTLKVISEKICRRRIGAASFSTRSPRGRKGAPSECGCGLPPGQNRSELLLRHGVCRGGNARESYQTLRPA